MTIRHLILRRGIVTRLLVLVLWVCASPAADAQDTSASAPRIEEVPAGAQQGAHVVTLEGDVMEVPAVADESTVVYYVIDAGVPVRMAALPNVDALREGDTVRASGTLRNGTGGLVLYPYDYKVVAVGTTFGFPTAAWWFAALAAAVALAGGVFFWFRRRGSRGRKSRHLTMLASSPGAVVMTDREWMMEEANVAATDLLGVGGDQLHRINVLSLMQTTTDLSSDDVHERLDAGKVVTFEAMLEDEGNARALLCSTRDVEVDGRTHLVTAIQDVTALKADERLFRAFHQQLVEHLPIEMAVLSPQGQYLLVNPAMASEAERARLLGMTDVDYCQKRGWHPEIALRRRSHRRRAVSSGEVVQFHETVPDGNGASRTFRRAYNPIRDNTGSITAVVMYGVETTELKRYAEQVEEVAQESERIEEMRETFLANVSHEFRTPLTGILGFAQILQEEVKDEQRELVDIIVRNGRRLMSTLNAMLDLSRLHSNYLHMTPQVFNLVDEVKEVAQSVAGLAQEKGLYLRMRATLPEILVRLDRQCLFRVLENLIGNAVKFTEKGGVVVEVHGDGEHVHVRVMDSGVGIRNEFLPFLFEEFNQESTGSTRHFEGAGIGLAIVKRLIDLMHGTISVDTEKGEGSTFTITFPAAFPQVKDGRPARSRVLVADDDEAVHTLIEYVLSPYFDVEYAPDFAALVRRAQEKKYDVVLLDADLDARNSASEALASIRDVRGYERVPVIALDEHAVRGGEVQYKSAGYDECLPKPLEKRDLLDALGQLLHGPSGAGTPVAVDGVPAHDAA